MWSFCGEGRAQAEACALGRRSERLAHTVVETLDVDACEADVCIWAICIRKLARAAAWV